MNVIVIVSCFIWLALMLFFSVWLRGALAILKKWKVADEVQSEKLKSIKFDLGKPKEITVNNYKTTNEAVELLRKYQGIIASSSGTLYAPSSEWETVERVIKDLEFNDFLTNGSINSLVGMIHKYNKQCVANLSIEDRYFKSELFAQYSSLNSRNHEN